MSTNRFIDSNIDRDYIITQSLNVASVAANTSAEQTFTVPGLSVGDFVAVSKPSLSAGLGVVNARVSAENTLALTFMNTTGAPIDPAAETYTIMVSRRDPDKPQGDIHNAP